MTKIEVLKELLKINLDELNCVFDLRLKIEFKGDEFLVLDKNNIVFRDDIVNYGLKPGCQERFVFDVLNKLFKYVRTFGSLEYDFIKVGEWNNLTKVTGYNEFIFEKFSILVKRKDFEKLNDEEFELYMKKMFKKISFNLDWDKIDVLSKKNMDGDYWIYVNFVINEKYLTYYYINEIDLQRVDNVVNSIKRLLKDKSVYIYYSDVDNEEVVKAVKYIEEIFNIKHRTFW